MSQANGAWYINGLSNPSIITNCDSIPIVGGPNIFTSAGSLSKTYNSLPATHNNLYFSLDLYLFPPFASNDYFSLTFDGQPLSIYTDAFISYNGPNACGQSGTFVANIFGQVAQSATTVNVKIDFKYSNPPPAGYGFRNLLLLFKQEDNTITQNILCYTSDAGSSCPCEKGQFNDGSSCQPCNKFCVACYGPTASECYQCATGTALNRNECILVCDSSCATCLQLNSNWCATCATNWVLDINRLCIRNTTPLFACQTLVVSYYNTVDLGHQYLLQLIPDSCDPGILLIKQNLIFSEEIAGSMPKYTWTISKTQHESYLLTLILSDTLLQSR